MTSGDAGAAGNFSRDEHYDYDTRYARGLEFVQVAQGLWDSYEEDAFPRDRATRTFLDPSRQHALNHKGEHFQVAGPLNVSRSPQGQPVIFQAGDSEQGRDLGATIGEGIFTHAASIEQGQAFYTDLKGRATAKGRDPDHIIVMPGVRCYVGDTDAEAREIEHDLQTQPTRTSTAPWPSSAARSPGTTSASTTWTPRSRRRHSCTPSAASAPARRRSPSWRRTTASRSGRRWSSISSPRPTPFAGSPHTVADHDPGVVRGPRPRRAQPAHRPPCASGSVREDIVPILQDRGPGPGTEHTTPHHTLRGNLGLPDSREPLHQGLGRG